MTPTGIMMIAGTSALSEELCKEILGVVSDFQARNPGVRDVEIASGLALARKQLGGTSARPLLIAGFLIVVLAVAASLALALSR